MKIWKWFSSLFLVTALIMLAACSSNDVTEIQLAEVTRSVFYTPQYVALEKGFFEEEGLDVDLQTTWGGDKTMTALLSDNADIALVGSETSIYVYGQDATDLVINFAQLTQTDGTFLVAKSEHPDFSWEETEGSSFLGQREGGMPQMVGEYVLKQHGLNPHKDLNLEQNIDFANISSAFVSTDAEYVQLFEPTASVFEKEGKGHVVASFGNELEEVPYTSFMAKKQFLENDKETIQKFTNAIYKAQQWVEETDSSEIAQVIAPYFEETDVEMLSTAIDRYKEQGSYSPNPELSEVGWDLLKDIMEEADELPKDIPYEELVNTDFAEEAMKK